MVDFTSALYLGWQHRGPEQCSEDQPLTLGKPAVLDEPPGSRELGAQIARLAGCEASLTAPSTLHLAMDVCGLLAGRGVDFIADRGVYPVSRWGLEVAKGRGARVQWFDHASPHSLEQSLARTHRRPVVMTDGFCPACGKVAPLREYLELVRDRDGLLLVDDTQAIGVLGETAGTSSPYGRGGGGSLRYLGLSGEHIILMSSLSKAFGAPLAVLAGSAGFMDEFERGSKTRIHCSPPSTAAVRAGLNALRRNKGAGEWLRSRLFQLVRRFRELMRNRGLALNRTLFPIQGVIHPAAAEIQERLAKNGVRTLLQRASEGRGMAVTFVINASHTEQDLLSAVQALDQWMNRGKRNGRSALV